MRRIPERLRAIGRDEPGAVVAARGRLPGRPRAVAQQEATGSKLFVDELQILGGTVTQLSALAVAIAEQQPDEWSALGR